MKRTATCLTIALLAAMSSTLIAQTSPSATDSSIAPSISASNGTDNGVAPVPIKVPRVTIKPFSRIAIGGGFSPMGIHLQAAVNANRYMNLRVYGNIFHYSVNNISTNGITVNGKLNLSSIGASLDYYPFPNHGFRLSPGVLFYNQNNVTAGLLVTGGTSFTLNDVTYYSSVANPVQGNGGLGLNTRNPAFTITTGWGNMIPRHGGHWSFPFEIGVALIGAPSVDFALTSGQVCTNPGGTVGCQNVADDAELNSNLQAQIAKYKNDLNPLQYYPILTGGVSYSFRIR